MGVSVASYGEFSKRGARRAQTGSVEAGGCWACGSLSPTSGGMGEMVGVVIGLGSTGEGKGEVFGVMVGLPEITISVFRDTWGSASGGFSSLRLPRGFLGPGFSSMSPHVKREPRPL